MRADEESTFGFVFRGAKRVNYGRSNTLRARPQPPLNSPKFARSAPTRRLWGPRAVVPAPPGFSGYKSLSRAGGGGNRSPAAPPPRRPKPTRTSTTARRAPPNRWPHRPDTPGSGRGFFLLANKAHPSPMLDPFHKPKGSSPRLDSRDSIHVVTSPRHTYHRSRTDHRP
jgi:hypothetical protein